MSNGEAPEAIDTRLVFRVYGLLALLGTLSTFVLTWIWIGSSPGLLAAAATVGLVGALSFIMAAYAMAFARVEDPAGRLTGLKTFAAGHVIAGAALWMLQQQARMPARSLGGSRLETIAAWTSYYPVIMSLFIGGAVLLYLAYTASPRSRFVMTVRSLSTALDGQPRMKTLHEKGRPASHLGLRSAYEEQIRHVARREERARLAADLHDAVKQQLFVIQAAAATVQARFDADPPGAKDAIEQVRNATREAMTEMEAMLDQVQAVPVENVGLIQALSKQCEALGFRTGAAVTFSPETLPPPTSLVPGAQLAIFRVAQEALANVGRHARAREVKVRLGVRQAGWNRALVLEVVDDGLGFDPIAPPTGMGIRNMQARAAEIGGRFELASGPGKGTTVSFAVPLSARSTRAYLMLSLAFASVLAVSVVLLFTDRSPLRALWMGMMWIGLIGTVRYVVALYRVSKASRQAR